MHISNFRLFGKHGLHPVEFATSRKKLCQQYVYVLNKRLIFLGFLLNGLTKWLYKI